MFRTRAGRFAALVAAGACTAALAGCDSNPEPAPLPTESASASTPTESSSPTPSVTPPTMPAAAKGTSEKSAKAFVRYWVSSLNYAADTGEVENLDSLSAAECEACTGIIDQIQRVHAGGGHYEGDGWRVDAIRAVSGQPKDRPILQVSMLVSEQDVFRGSGSKPRHFEGGRQPMDFRLTRQAGWLVARIDQT